MNRIKVFVMLCLLGLQVFAQDGGDILMKVGEKSVTTTDFLRFVALPSNHSRTLDACLESYKDYLTKVAYAEKEGFASSPQLVQMMDLLQKGSLDQVIDQELEKGALHGTSLLIGHLILPLKQHSADFSEQNRLKSKMDSICQEINRGKDFMTVVNAVSPQTRNQYWISRNHLLAEVEQVAYSLSEGQVSQPILATDGYHLVKVLKKAEYQEIPYEERTTSVASPLRNQALLDEYKNGLILNELYKIHNQDLQEATDEQLKSFFNTHRKDYTWDVPRFKGVVYFCKDKKNQKKIARLFKKYPMEQWESLTKDSAYASLFEKVQLLPLKLYKLSQNPWVDELVFGGPRQERQAEAPFVGIAGKKMKKGPDSYEDVHELLEHDYELYQEVQWMEAMRKAVPVQVNENVLKKIKENFRS